MTTMRTSQGKDTDGVVSYDDLGHPEEQADTEGIVRKMSKSPNDVEETSCSKETRDGNVPSLSPSPSSSSNLIKNPIFTFAIGIVIGIIIIVLFGIVFGIFNPKNEGNDTNSNGSPTEIPAIMYDNTPMPTASSSVIASPEPTSSPTENSWKPTFSPTTSVPSKEPTALPTKSPTMPPTKRPTPQPTSQLQAMADILNIENLHLLSETSPEIQALQWITYEDPLRDELLAPILTSTTPTVISLPTDYTAHEVLYERYLYVVLYYSLNSPSWDEQNNFLTGTHVCEWNNGFESGAIQAEGIYCNRLGETTTIELNENGLEGNLPSHIGELTRLRRLELCCNSLTGEIPTALSSLTYLRWLSLGANQLAGTIPDAMSQMTHLTDLDLWRNLLTGTIPESFGDLTRLTDVDLSWNRLTGTVPSSLGGLTLLQKLMIHRTELSGDLDSVFCFRTVPTSLLFPFWADCAEPDPEVTCSCCSACY